MAKKGKSTSPAGPSKPAKSTARAKVRASRLPICVALVFCDQVVIGNDNAPSAIRIVDNVTVPPDFVLLEGKEGIAFPNLQLLAVLKKGESIGPFDVKLVCVEPTGKKVPLGTAVGINIEGSQESGGIINSHVRLSGGKEGLYWIELLVGKSMLGRTPLRVKHGKEKESESSKTPSPEQA